jgi:hypothetical protein
MCKFFCREAAWQNDAQLRGSSALRHAVAPEVETAFVDDDGTSGSSAASGVPVLITEQGASLGARNPRAILRFAIVNPCMQLVSMMP